MPLTAVNVVLVETKTLQKWMSEGYEYDICKAELIRRDEYTEDGLFQRDEDEEKKKLKAKIEELLREKSVLRREKDELAREKDAQQDQFEEEMADMQNEHHRQIRELKERHEMENGFHKELKIVYERQIKFLQDEVVELVLQRRESRRRRRRGGQRRANIGALQPRRPIPHHARR